MAFGNDALPSPVTQLLDEENKPLSIVSDWKTVIDAGGMDDTDSLSANPNPATEGSDSDHHHIVVGNKGTGIVLRMVYDDGDTVTTSPVVNVFGWNQARTEHTALADSKGAYDIPVTAVDASDETDGTNNYTKLLPTGYTSMNRIDAAGSYSITVHVKTAYAATGDASLAYLQAKELN